MITGRLSFLTNSFINSGALCSINCICYKIILFKIVNHSSNSTLKQITTIKDDFDAIYPDGRIKDGVNSSIKTIVKEITTLLI